MIKIGAQSLKTAVPEDLDGRLRALTGCCTDEVVRLLKHPCLAGFVARALLPLLVEPPVRSDLARAIAAAGVPKVQKRLHRLLTAAAKPAKGPTHAEVG